MRSGNRSKRSRRVSTRNAIDVAIRKDLAAKLRDCAEALDLSHEAIANCADCWPRTIGAYMRGERDINFAKIKRCKELYDRFIRCEYVSIVRGRR